MPTLLMFVLRTKLCGVILILLGLAAWELLSIYGVLYPVYFPPVSKIFVALGESLRSGELIEHYRFSLMRAATGYGVAACLAIILGLIIGYSPVAYNLTEPLTELLRPIPSSAIIPMVILLLGIGDAMKIFIVAWASFWPILINTIEGVRGIDRLLVDTARTFGSTEGEMLRKIIIPAASPQIATGMRISLALALILVVVSEMIAGRNGIGFYILDAERTFRVSEMYAGIFSLAAVGYALNGLFVKLNAKALAWHHGLTSKEIE